MYKLIIADDEQIALEQFSLAYDWNSMGFELAGAFNSGKAALEYIRSNPVDALLSDVKMPHISGIDLARECYENHPRVGVILISAYRDFEYAHQALWYNVVDYVLKPINEEKFLKSIAKLKAHLEKREKRAETPAISSAVRDAVAYVKEHYGNEITAETVAKKVMVSPEYFGTYFKKNYGQNFTAFLREVRMNAARDLLYNNDLTIAAVAEMVGYKTSSHFYEIFQSYFGMTPSQFRKSINKH